MPASGLMIMVIAFCMHASLLVGYFFHLSLLLLLFGFALKFLCDFTLLSVPLVKTRQFAQLKYFGLFEIYYILYVIMLPFAVFLGGKVLWKGRKY